MLFRSLEKENQIQIAMVIKHILYLKIFIIEDDLNAARNGLFDIENRINNFSSFNNNQQSDSVSERWQY